MSIDKRVLIYVEAELGIPRDVFLGSSRSRKLFRSRALAAAILRRLGFSYTVIGSILGGRDHTTVINALKKLENDKDIIFLATKFFSEYGKSVKDSDGKILPRGRYAAVYEKFGGRCYVCGFDEVVEIHRLIPPKLGGNDNVEEMVVLCPNHHALADRGMLSIKRYAQGPRDTKLSTYPQA